MAMNCPQKVKRLAVSGENTVPDSTAMSYDDMIKPEHTLKIFQLIPGASLCIFPDSNHGVCQQHPKLFNESVLTFFKTIFL